MYRAITLQCLRQGVAAHDMPRLAEIVKSARIAFTGPAQSVRVILDGEDVSEQIRGDEVTRHVSDYCAPRVVREALVARQRMIAGDRSVVCEGRDIGTAVFPAAQLKVYMVASAEERARRRMKDFERLGVSKSFHALVEEIKERDRKDSTRECNPLIKAPDAELLDTTNMTLEQQIDFIVFRAREIAMAETREL